MGNYKSRPHLSCTDELKKRISESYAIVRSKLNEDSKARICLWNPLQIACYQGTLKEVEDLLVDLKGLEDICPSRELSLLHICAIGSSPVQNDKIQLIFSKAESEDSLIRHLLSKKTKNGFSALHLAIKSGDIGVIRKLLKCGFNVNEINENVPPALHLAAIFGSVDIVELLITNGANIHFAADFVQFTPLLCATFFNDEKVVKTLLKYGADPNYSGGIRDTPLHIAASKSNLAITKLLISAGADPFLADDEANHALIFSVKSGNLNLVDEILQKVSPCQQQDLIMNSNVYGDTSLHVSCYSGKLDIAKKLLKIAGSTILTMENNFSETPLLAACTSGKSLELIAFLLRQPAVDVNYQGKDGHTALHSASWNGHLHIVQYLLDNGADQFLTAKAFDVSSSSTTSSAVFALSRLDSSNSLAHSSKSSSISTFEDSGYIPSSSQTPIIWAYEKGHDQIVALLKYYASKKFESDVCSEYSSGSSSYTPLPSPMGRLRSMTKEKTEILQLRSQLPNAFQLYLLDVELLEAIGTLLSSMGRPFLDSFWFEGLNMYATFAEPYTMISMNLEADFSFDNLSNTFRIHFILRVKCKKIIYIWLINIKCDSGSFGKVYKGLLKGHPVAIKKYKAISFGAKTEVDMFCREVTILHKMKHPNIVGFIGACLDDPSQFAIVTEFVAGGSLFCLLHKEKRIFEMPIKLSIGLDIAKGMCYLHEKTLNPVLHRDLNSHNILLHDNGRAVIADFGESRFATQRDDDSMTKQPGNLRWMAPEIFTQSCRYDQKVDVFSYALVLWETHSSELPFSHLKPAAAAAEMAYKRTRPALPAYPTNNFPEHIVSLISMAWNQEPTQRPSFPEIVSMIEKHVDKDAKNNFSIGNISSAFEGFGLNNDMMSEMDSIKSVCQLRTQWENRMRCKKSSLSGTSTSQNLEIESDNHNQVHLNNASSKTIEALRLRLDSNGYVSQAAKAISAAKNASALRDSFILARSDSVAKRQTNFATKEDDYIHSEFVICCPTKTGSQETLKYESASNSDVNT
uniref:Protein kinase domain-containing protein n=1 Tax=Rhabditophanes sp. KR3021 TaxID=114890 RepID=A0AC35TH32_9BILA